MKSERSLDSPNLRESARRTVSSHAPDTHSPGLHPLPCLQHVLWPRKHILHSARVYGSLTDPWLRLQVEHPTLYPRGLEGSLRTLERSSSRRQGLGRLHNQVFAQEVHPQTTKLASASPASLCQSIFDNQDNTKSWVKGRWKMSWPILGVNCTDACFLNPESPGAKTSTPPPPVSLLHCPSTVLTLM